MSVLWPSKYAKIRFRPGLCPGPRWGSSRRSPRPLSRLKRGHPSPYSTILRTDPPSALAMRPARSPARSTPMPFPWHTWWYSCDVCLEVREIIRTVVSYCVLKLCAVISTLRWAVSSLDWVLSHWAYVTVHRFICVICVYLCAFVSYCIVVLLWAQWGGPGGTEAP